MRFYTRVMEEGRSIRWLCMIKIWLIGIVRNVADAERRTFNDE